MRCTVEERFWSKVQILGPDDCWPWQRSLNTNGYGQFRVSVRESPKKASRVAWQLTFSDPGKLHVLHSCDNPPCCNPAHLFLGTVADNTADMMTKGRQRYNRDALVTRVRRLSDDQIAEARRRHDGGESRRSIARSFGVANTTIDDLINGESWREMV